MRGFQYGGTLLYTRLKSCYFGISVIGDISCLYECFDDYGDYFQYDCLMPALVTLYCQRKVSCPSLRIGLPLIKLLKLVAFCPF